MAQIARILQAKTENNQSMEATNRFDQLVHSMEEKDIVISHNLHGLSMQNKDAIFSFLILSYCSKGSVRMLYDMNEITQYQNELMIIMPGHVVRPLDSTDDFTFTSVAVSSKLFSDLHAHVFSHDYGKFHLSPLCVLTNEQVGCLLKIVDLLEVMETHSEEEFKYRRQMVLSQLAISYEFINFYRREQDQTWHAGRNVELYHRFCQLVVEHYRESREVMFYAGQLHMTPKHFTKVIRQVSGGITPSEWIEQYVVTQAKRLIETQPDHTIKEIAYMLGFDEPTTFHRYFKRVTGTTAKHFKASLTAAKP